jgi:peptide/nickel transport system permease protein
MAQEAAVPFEIAEEDRPRTGRVRKLLTLARQHPLGVMGLFFVGLLVVAGVFSELLAPYDPLENNRVTREVGQLGAAVRAEDKQVQVLNFGAGTNSVLEIGNEKMTVLYILSQSGRDAVVQVQRGREGTVQEAHEAGAQIISTKINKLEGPSWSHPFGTDSVGYDVMSRTIFGARISLLIGFVAISVGVSVGTLFGVISGYFGGIIDMIIQRIVDMLLAFPAVVLLLAIIAVIGDEDSAVRRFLADNTPIPQGTFLGVPVFLDIFVVALGIGVAVAVGTARIVRGAVLSLKENVYIEAARAMGASDIRIMWRHIFPNVAALVVILASVFLPIAILAEAAISFLGVGVPYPTPSWGADLTGTNRDDALQGYWWPVFFPGLALSLVVLGFNMLGDAFRDISDPRLRGGMGAGGSAGGSRGGGL